jgi:16S rRNA (uracil1498-N3)-methyltransferase
MHYFYYPNFFSSQITLCKEESKHLSILRKQPGDEVFVTNGKGLLAKAEILCFNKSGAELLVKEEVENHTSTNKLHIAIAPTKNIERTEWFVEKCCEIGISEISFIQCEHSERKKINIERFEKIVISACKQSQKIFFPELSPLENFKTFVKINSTKQKFIAHCSNESLPHLKKVLSDKECLILIGPEGDFSKEEILFSRQHNFSSISLGTERLRTETAGVYACTVYNILT